MKTQEVVKYIEMRNKNQYDITWFYNHYIESSQDRSMNFDRFSQVFRMSNFDSILDHIDNKFKLDKLYDKDNKFIKCYLPSN